MYNTYSIVMTMELGSIGIKYQGSVSNPFQHSTPTMLLFLTAALCHAVASSADMNLAATVIVLHLPGVVGCEILLCILLPEPWSWCLINALLLLLLPFCFFNCSTIHNIIRQFFFSAKAQNVPNLELQQEPQEP